MFSLDKLNELCFHDGLVENYRYDRKNMILSLLVYLLPFASKSWKDMNTVFPGLVKENDGSLEEAKSFIVTLYGVDGFTAPKNYDFCFTKRYGYKMPVCPIGVCVFAFEIADGYIDRQEGRFILSGDINDGVSSNYKYSKKTKAYEPVEGYSFVAGIKDSPGFDIRETDSVSLSDYERKQAERKGEKYYLDIESLSSFKFRGKKLIGCDWDEKSRVVRLSFEEGPARKEYDADLKEIDTPKPNGLKYILTVYDASDFSFQNTAEEKDSSFRKEEAPAYVLDEDFNYENFDFVLYISSKNPKENPYFESACESEKKVGYDRLIKMNLYDSRGYEFETISSEKK